MVRKWRGREKSRPRCLHRDGEKPAVSMFNMNFNDLPEEMQNQIKAQMRQAELAQMDRQSRLHGMQTFIQGLDEHQLRAFKTVLEVCANVPQAVHFYIGITAGFQAERHGVCVNCGVNHEVEEMERLMNEGKEDGPAVPDDAVVLIDLSDDDDEEDEDGGADSTYGG